MVGPDRKHGILTTDNRDYLSGRKDLVDDAERNARKRVRDRTRDGLYDFEYLTEGLEDRDVTQIVTDNGEVNERVFEAAEDVIAFLFRMCAHAPETTGQSTDEQFRAILQNGLRKGVKELNYKYELLDFNLDMQYGLPREAQAQLQRKLREGKRLTLAELREAINNEYLDDTFQFKPLDQDGLPKNVDPEDVISHDDFR